MAANNLNRLLLINSKVVGIKLVVVSTEQFSVSVWNKRVVFHSINGTYTMHAFQQYGSDKCFQLVSLSTFLSSTQKDYILMHTNEQPIYKMKINGHNRERSNDLDDHFV